MSTFTPNTLAVYTAKNKTQKLVKILGYTKGKNPDILRVIALQDLKPIGKPFNVMEASCRPSNELDEIRNLSDTRLNKLLSKQSHSLFADMRRPKLIRAYGSIKMDRPIDVTKHYIIPGGYYVADAKGNDYSFDFHQFTGNISTDDPSVLDIEMTTLDIETFPEAEYLFDHLEDIVAFPECYVYTGEDEDPEIRVEKVLSFTLEFTGNSVCNGLPNTPYLTCSSIDTTKDSCIQCTLTDKLLDTIELYPNG